MAPITRRHALQTLGVAAGGVLAGCNTVFGSSQAVSIPYSNKWDPKLDELTLTTHRTFGESTDGSQCAVVLTNPSDDPLSFGLLLKRKQQVLFNSDIEFGPTTYRAFILQPASDYVVQSQGPGVTFSLTVEESWFESPTFGVAIDITRPGQESISVDTDAPWFERVVAGEKR